jgi:L-fuculose-phosphate aldolase
MSTPEIIKTEVAAFMQRLYNKGLTTSLGGNISCRIDDNLIAITSSQTDKATISANEIGIVDLNGNSKTPDIKLSMETWMHLGIYNKRKDINAIVHAHPPFSSVFAVSSKKINCRLSGEGRALLGEPSYAPYALMGTKELAKIVSDYSLSSNVIFMQNHGIITLGDSLLIAFDRLEVAEFTSRLTIFTEIMGDKHELNDEQVKGIDLLMKS